MKRNLKIFLWSGISFGTVMGARYSHLYGPAAGLKGGILSGLLFGTLMFIIMGFLHTHAVKKMVTNNSGNALRTHHVRDLDLKSPYDRAYDLCISSLSLFRRCIIQEEDRSLGRIVARTGINWKTWGDLISITIKRTDNGYTYIEISSRPNARTTIVDYGKNLENVEKIVSFLKKNIRTA
jgi:hypothetical protein